MMNPKKVHAAKIRTLKLFLHDCDDHKKDSVDCSEDCEADRWIANEIRKLIEREKKKWEKKTVAGELEPKP